MIMTTSEHFDTILDSLRDAADNAFNALDALPTDSWEREAALDVAYDYDRLVDRWEAGLPVDDDNDLALLLGALTRSEAVCRELADQQDRETSRAYMLRAADEYEAARLHMEG